MMRPLHEPGFCSLAPRVGALGEAKAHGMRAFIAINGRLSTLLTPPEGKRTIVQRSLNVNPDGVSSHGLPTNGNSPRLLLWMISDMGCLSNAIFDAGGMLASEAWTWIMP